MKTYFPAWPHVVNTIQRDLEVEAEESVDFTEVALTAELPDVLVKDWTRVAQQLGWSLGRVVAYLALQGAIKISAEGERATTS